MRLKDKVVIITGAGSGLGKETALLFAKEGAKVVVADFNFEASLSVVNEINKGATVALPIKVDVSNRTSVQNVVDSTIEQFGSIDILINNAGITMDAQLVKMTEEQFDRVIDVNLKGVFNCTQAVAPHMVAQGSGRIISTASVVALYGNFGQTNYVAAKSAVIGMTKTWARELGRKGVTVNAVAPGFILTPMTEKMPEKVLDTMRSKVPMGTLGEPADIANAYLFLASDDAKYINGTVLSVDGGLTV